MSPGAHAATLRVATLNCWNVCGPFEERAALIRRDIAALRPDVIGLQEIVVRRDGFDQAAVLLDGLGYNYVFGAAMRWTETEPLLPFDHPAGDAFGNVVASPWPIRRHAILSLPGSEAVGERRSATAALVETPAGVLPFITTHFSWKVHHGWVREQQAIAVADLAASWAADGDLPPVLVGDLNAEPDAQEIRFLCGLASLDGRSTYFQDAWRVIGEGPGITWDNRNPYAAGGLQRDRRIDYILVGEPQNGRGRGWVESVRLAFTEPADDVFPSDHFGVVADIRA
jgi:endonuclease/exonuclease/phosphatase family metal-dependent hydrolase